jgi:transposase-like protein
MTSKVSDSKTADLRQAIALAKRGLPNAHVPMELRKKAVEAMEAGKERGVGKKETAAALGVHPATLLNWQKALGSQKSFVRARVVPQTEAKLVENKHPPMQRLRVMVIDGLDVAMLAALLRSGS